MKVIKYIVLGLLMFVNSLHSQSTNVDWNVKILEFYPELKKVSDFNNDSFNKYFEIVLNEYRDSLGLQRVHVDSSIKVLAVDQCNYNLGTHQITHIQKNKKKRAHWDRAKYYGLPYDAYSLGENLMIEGITVPNYFKKQYFDEYHDYNLNLMVAKEYLDGWKNSPGHNEVLVDPSFNIFYIYRVLDKKEHFKSEAYSYTTLVMANKK